MNFVCLLLSFTYGAWTQRFVTDRKNWPVSIAVLLNTHAQPASALFEYVK